MAPIVIALGTLLLPLGLLLGSSAMAGAADYPLKPVTLIVPFAAGGANDTLSRILAEHMSKTLGQTIVIEIDPGAGGTTGVTRTAQAQPDGYTLVMGNMGTHGVAPNQYPHLKYDPAQSFAPIGLVADVPAVIVGRKNFPADTLKDFVAYVRAHQDKVSEAHVGIGSPTHSFCTLLHNIMGTRIARPAYKGGGQIMNDLVAGQVDFSCISLSGAIGQIDSGQVKTIAIAAPERAAVLKSVPTTAEAGMPEFQVSTWNALFAPAGLPPAIAARLNAAVGMALDDPAVRDRLLALGFVLPQAGARTADALAARVGSEVTRWREIVKPATASN